MPGEGRLDAQIILDQIVSVGVKSFVSFDRLLLEISLKAA